MEKLEPVIFRGFTGVNTLANTWELETHELVKCTNYDITKKGKLISRTGRTSKLTGGYTDLWTNGNIILANRNGALVQVSNEFASYSTLRSGIGTAGMLTYADCNGRVVWSNGTSIEYVENGYSRAMPTPTDANKSAFPACQLLEWFKGCLWGAAGGTVWQSDPFVTRFGSLDKRRNSRQFAGDVTLLKGVDDGMWFSDPSGIYFASGLSIVEMQVLNKVADYPALKGMFCKVDGSFLPQAIPGACWAIGTEKGICIIGNGGMLQNVTEKYIPMTTGTKGAMVFNKGTTGLNQIIAVSRS